MPKQFVIHFARATDTESFQMTSEKNFYHRLEESIPDTRLALLESRIVAISTHSYSWLSGWLHLIKSDSNNKVY